MHEQSEGSEELTACDTVTDALGLRLEEVQDLSVENRESRCGVHTSQNRKNEIISSVRDSTLEAGGSKAVHRLRRTLSILSMLTSR